MNWRFSRQVWLYLIAVFSFGLSQAFASLFLNFYLRALGLDAAWQGLINALPAISMAALSLPAVVLARRISNAHTLKIGAALGAVIVNYAKTVLTGAMPDAWLFALGALFVLVTLFLPKGIVGTLVETFGSRRAAAKLPPAPEIAPKLVEEGRA